MLHASMLVPGRARATTFFGQIDPPAQVFAEVSSGPLTPDLFTDVRQRLDRGVVRHLVSTFDTLAAHRPRQTRIHFGQKTYDATRVATRGLIIREAADQPAIVAWLVDGDARVLDPREALRLARDEHVRVDAQLGVAVLAKLIADEATMAEHKTLREEMNARASFMQAARAHFNRASKCEWRLDPTFAFVRRK